MVNQRGIFGPLKISLGNSEGMPIYQQNCGVSHTNTRQIYWVLWYTMPLMNHQTTYGMGLDEVSMTLEYGVVTLKL